MTLIYIGILAATTTMIGGYFALYFKDRLHLVLGYSAGAVMGVAMFDLIPEAIELGAKNHTVSTITSVVALGFAIYLVLDRALSYIKDDRSHYDNHDTHHRDASVLGPISLIIHSLLDGLAIGFAFQVSSTIGTVVAVAVLLHDFSDGINTINLSLIRGNISKAKSMLYLDAIAPAIGIVLSQFIILKSEYLSIVLAIFAGFFLYIGASELIPESQHRHPHFWTSLMTVLGMLTLYFIILIPTLY